MPVFKLFFKIIQKNKFTFILTLIINLSVTLLVYSQTLGGESTGSFTPNTNKIAIFDEDKEAVSKALIDYLAKETTIASLDKSESAQQDALFFNDVDYILTIPKNFSKKIIEGKKVSLPIKSLPNSTQEFQLSNRIDEFIGTFQFYTTNFPEKNATQLSKMTNKGLKTEQRISFLSPEKYNRQKDKTTKMFNLLAYGLFMSILSSIGFISVSLNKKGMRDRNACSPLSLRKQSIYLYGAIGIFSLVSWIIFSSIALVLSKSSMSELYPLLLIGNSLAFLLVLISLAVFLSNFFKKEEATSAVNTVLSLGTCFISGVFVPREFMSPVVLKLASFFPTYWFVSNNELVGSVATYNKAFYQDFGFNIIIQLLFTVVFLLATLLIRKEKGGSKFTALKTS